MKGSLVTLEGPEAVARAAAQGVVALAQVAQATRGRFAVALSGGSTPRLLHRFLATEPLRSQVDWGAVDVFWGDERAVPPTHADSNYRMARETLLDHVDISSTRIHRMKTEEVLSVAVTGYEAALARILGGARGGAPPRLDLILLGMGTDAHTASLFPGTVALAETRRWVVAHRIPKLDADRVTLTYAVLNAAAHVMFDRRGQG